MRIGIGYDIHRLVEGRSLIVGGVPIPFDKGLLGHSDGDALLHAIADAILGASAQGDIGAHFPDDDPAYRGADSSAILRRAVEIASRAGFKPLCCDANVIAERPKMAPFIARMREGISALLNLPPDAVSIKARTNEGLDAVGRGEAIAAQAVVLIAKIPSPL